MNATLDTTLGTLLDDPQAKAVIDQYIPGASSNPLIGMAKGMSLRTIVAMPQAAMFGLTEAKANEILAEINKL
jgi:para-nitrobenzyl esterase